MEIKKSPKVNLENKKIIFFEIGLIISMLIALIAFEWTFTESQDKIDLSKIQQVQPMVEEMTPITYQEDLKLPEPPKVQVIPDAIKVVDNSKDVSSNMDIFDPDFADKTAIEVVNYAGAKDEAEEDEMEAFLIVEDMPTFGKGGLEEFRLNYVQKNMIYPDAAAEKNIQGRVLVSFIVNEKGDVCNVKIVKGVEASLDKEAIRVVSGSPKWKPGKRRGKPVRVQYTMPIIFMLQ